MAYRKQSPLSASYLFEEARFHGEGPGERDRGRGEEGKRGKGEKGKRGK
jgi:hypothetical protein